MGYVLFYIIFLGEVLLIQKGRLPLWRKWGRDISSPSFIPATNIKFCEAASTLPSKRSEILPKTGEWDKVENGLL